MPDTLSPWQRAVAQTYGGGDYAHIQSVDEARDVGDSLFTFLMVELAPSEGCESAEEAERRIEAARDDLDGAYHAVVKIAETERRREA